MKIVAMIPARLGSKRIPKKNIRLLNNKPLVQYVIDAAKESECFDEIYLNSESDLLEEIAENTSIKFYKSYEDFKEAKINKRIILATTKAKEIYTNFKFKKDDTLLFGRESSGVPESLHKSIKFKIKIPLIENKRSLNLATSAAIIISESLRQTFY